MKIADRRRALARLVFGTLIVGVSLIGVSCQQPSPETTGQAGTGTFRIEEATIADVHRAIQQGS